jgi:hypothetical protein
MIPRRARVIIKLYFLILFIIVGAHINRRQCGKIKVLIARPIRRKTENEAL